MKIYIDNEVVRFKNCILWSKTNVIPNMQQTNQQTKGVNKLSTFYDYFLVLFFVAFVWCVCVCVLTFSICIFRLLFFISFNFMMFFFYKLANEACEKAKSENSGKTLRRRRGNFEPTNEQ